MNKWYPVRYIASLLWLGFLLAISFMEAPLKFQAPSVTIPIGLEVGRLVFGALNKVEWGLMLAIGLSLWRGGKPRKSLCWALGIVLSILLGQTFYLLPALDVRALLIIQGESVPSSNLHITYIVLEVLKLTCLLWFSIRSIYQKVDGDLEQVEAL